MKKLVLISALILSVSIFVSAQTVSKPTVSGNASGNKSALKNSPAYAEVLLRKTELQASVEDMLVEYTEDYPKLKESRFELAVLTQSLDRILAVNPNEAGKLTEALGKLLLRKAELETDLWALRQKLGDEHENVKRMKRKIAVFDQAVKEILP